MTTVIKQEPLTAKLPNGHMKYGNTKRNILAVLQIEIARYMMRVKLSKKARATRSLLKVLRKCICMRIMIMMAFPKIPKMVIISLVKKSTHDANSSYTTLTGLPHFKSVTLFVTISASLVQASPILILSNEENSLEGHTDVSFASFTATGIFEVKCHISDASKEVDYLSLQRRISCTKPTAFLPPQPVVLEDKEAVAQLGSVPRLYRHIQLASVTRATRHFVLCNNTL